MMKNRQEIPSQLKMELKTKNLSNLNPLVQFHSGDICNTVPQILSASYILKMSAVVHRFILQYTLQQKDTSLFQNDNSSGIILLVSYYRKTIRKQNYRMEFSFLNRTAHSRIVVNMQ